MGKNNIDIQTIAERWLDSCAAIFDGEGGYVRLTDGGYEFEPAPLVGQVSTAILVSLLETADALNEEEYRHILSVGDHYRTLIEHLHRRALTGDPASTAALEARMARRLTEE